MSKYVFNQYNSSRYEKDPVFGTTNFILFGNPMSLAETPDLFHIELPGKRRFAYCLIHPWSISGDKGMLLKVKRYLLFHENNEDLQKPINTYFIGNMQKSIDASNDFTGQNIILVTYEMIDQWYPKTIEEIVKMAVEQVCKTQKYIGQQHRLGELSDDYLFTDLSLSDLEKRDYRTFILRSMEELGYISPINNAFVFDGFVLTSKAIASVQTKNNETSKTAFIAIKFNNNEERINIIQDAIAEAGFEPIIMNRVETNNWIMPEIFYQIKQCKFVIADFSLPCDGAYYEAGYAAALEKPVIHLFDKREENEKNKLHFDIAQKSTIFYDDFVDLKIRLKNRIKATIR